MYEKTSVQGVYKYTSAVRVYRGQADICYYIMYRDIAGKVRREKVGWASKGWTINKAATQRTLRLAAIHTGEPLPWAKKEIPTFQAVAAEYLDWALINHCRGGRDDETRYRLHIAPRLDEKKMNEITTLDIENLKAELQDYADATIAHVVKLVRMIFNKAAVWGLYDGPNPVTGVKMPRINNARERFLSFVEAKALLKALGEKSATVHDMALLSLCTGMRAGEIFNVTAQDIDLKNGIITIMDAKNGTARKSFISGDVAAMLKKRMPKDREGLIFTGRHGEKINEISDTFARTADKLFNQGVTDRRQRVTFHTLRHTFASWMALQGSSILVIKDLLGHKSLKMTERYAHLIPDAKRVAARGVATAFANVRGKAKK